MSLRVQSLTKKILLYPPVKKTMICGWKLRKTLVIRCFGGFFLHLHNISFPFRQSSTGHIWYFCKLWAVENRSKRVAQLQLWNDDSSRVEKVKNRLKNTTSQQPRCINLNLKVPQESRLFSGANVHRAVLLACQQKQALV